MMIYTTTHTEYCICIDRRYCLGHTDDASRQNVTTNERNKWITKPFLDIIMHIKRLKYPGCSTCQLYACKPVSQREPTGSIVVKCDKIFKTEKTIEIQSFGPTEVCGEV